jgi:hypothetical protein
MKLRICKDKFDAKRSGRGCSHRAAGVLTRFGLGRLSSSGHRRIFFPVSKNGGREGGSFGDTQILRNASSADVAKKCKWLMLIFNAESNTFCIFGITKVRKNDDDSHSQRTSHNPDACCRLKSKSVTSSVIPTFGSGNILKDVKRATRIARVWCWPSSRRRKTAPVVRVLPVTHTAPDNPTDAVEIPQPVKDRLGLDDDRSWIVLTESNRFVWPGPDIRPTATESGYYGAIPPALFDKVKRRFIELARERHHTSVGRTV